MQDFAYAVKEKVTPDHEVIDEAIKEEGDVSLVSEIVQWNSADSLRVTQSSLSRLVSFTGQTAPKSRISRPKTT